MADLVSEKEYQESIKGGVKTWVWLKSLFGAKELSDDEFRRILLEEANKKSGELDSEIKDFNQEFLETSQMIDSKESQSHTKENLNNANTQDKKNDKEFSENFLVRQAHRQ